jgi:hypothetical protein
VHRGAPGASDTAPTFLTLAPKDQENEGLGDAPSG